MSDDDFFQQAIDAVDKAEPDTAPATTSGNTAPPASTPTTSLPWQKLRGTDEVMTFIETSSRVLKGQMDIAKGGDILSDARVSSMVQARAGMFGEDPAMLMGQITKAGNAAGDMVANMEAGYPPAPERSHGRIL